MYALFYDGETYRGYKQLEYAGEENTFELQYDMVLTLPAVLSDIAGANFYFKRTGAGVYERVDLPQDPPTQEQLMIEALQRQVAAANEANLTTMSALADVYEQVLALQEQLAQYQGTVT